MMEEERIFVIGDIHGCLELLKRLMDKIQWQPDKDRLIFLGDYIDRGADPKGVVDFILDLSKNTKKIECLMGNHEASLLDFIDGKNREIFFLNGGLHTLESYSINESKTGNTLIPIDHMEFYRSLNLFIELDDYYVVHAGFRPGVKVQEQDFKDMIWIREPFLSSEYDFGKRIIFGHTPFNKSLIMENKIGLDTGAVYGNRLTCLELPDMKFHSVKA